MKEFPTRFTHLPSGIDNLMVLSLGLHDSIWVIGGKVKIKGGVPEIGNHHPGKIFGSLFPVWNKSPGQGAGYGSTGLSALALQVIDVIAVSPCNRVNPEFILNSGFEICYGQPGAVLVSGHPAIIVIRTTSLPGNRPCILLHYWCMKSGPMRP